MKNISCSLIISTYNWPKALYLCLQSVFKQTILPNEIIIADDGSTEDTKKLIDELKKQSPVPIIHIWHEDRGFRKTLILNKAMNFAKCEYIIEIDGDIILGKNFVKDHLNAAKKGYFISGNRVLLTEKLTESVLKNNRIRFSFFTRGLKKRHYAIRIPFLSLILKVKPNHTSTILGCNLSFWRTDFMSVNGYNNDMEGWGHEDIELTIRLVKYGVMCCKLRFSTNEYHIYHPENSRTKERGNHNILTKTLESEGYACTNGVNQVG